MPSRIRHCFSLLFGAAVLSPSPVASFISPSLRFYNQRSGLLRGCGCGVIPKEYASCLKATSKDKAKSAAEKLPKVSTAREELEVFQKFADFLRKKQVEIIDQLESTDGSGERFTRDAWGFFSEMSDNEMWDDELPKIGAGGITRVIQGGNIIEKGACSLTIIQNGVLSPQRAAAIRARQPKYEEEEDDEEDDNNEDDDDNDDFVIGSGDFYSAAALSIVLHSRSPMVPTFRSDVRIFLVQDASSKEKKRPVMAWFGGGADLTPYYLFDEDIASFHNTYKQICGEHQQDYDEMKQDCDDYFYLPAREEHRGTGGIFFDDMEADEDNNFEFVQAVANAWMPSWLPIVQKRQPMPYTDQQKQWQKLRRGRYLEFNLLYDRGVKFGLQTANPRVEGVMVSAPPEIAFEYNHKIAEGSEEERLMKILKDPIDWAK